MQPVLKNTEEKKLIGKRLRMSISGYKAAELFRSFIPFRDAIANRTSPDMYDMQVYPDTFSFLPFDIHSEFDKWAAVEVSEFGTVPGSLETFLLPAGKYAVFIHKGPASEAERTFRYIFQDWLPASGYELDQRPHFCLMDAKYTNNTPDSEEEIWIPVK